MARNGGRSAEVAKTKEQLNREMRQKKLDLFIQHFEKEGLWMILVACEMPILSLLDFTRWIFFVMVSPHSTWPYQGNGEKNGRYVGDGGQGLQSGAAEDATFSAKHTSGGFNKW